MPWFSFSDCPLKEWNRAILVKRQIISELYVRVHSWSEMKRTMSDMNRRSIAWNDVYKKEARGNNDYDLGEVQDFGQNYVHTQRGMGDKTQFYIPKYLVEGYDGSTLWFNVNEGQAAEFARDSPPNYNDYANRYKTRDVRADIEQRIPLIEEKLNVSKRTSQREAVIKKEPVTETKTMEVPVTHEELRVERRPASGSTTTREGPVDRETEIRVPLQSEDVEVSKTPQVREEVVVKKTPVTETQRVSEQVKSERIKSGVPGQTTTDEEEE